MRIILLASSFLLFVMQTCFATGLHDGSPANSIIGITKATDSFAHPDFISTLPDHPRLLLLKGEETQLVRFIESGQCWRTVHDEILSVSEKLLPEPCLERVMVGRRLLGVSRKALRNTFFLSYSYRTTGDERFAERAVQELLSVCGFTDWNPGHFLDVGEMSLGVAIGYDWLYDYLTEDSRRVIREALVSKGLNPSLNSGYSWFLRAKNNWNQVCNAGMLYAAMAVANDYPELADQIIRRSIETLYMDDYAPDGIYAEGASYWIYGTSFNALLISALEKAMGSDFGLTSKAGFARTPHYAQHMVAPDNRIFNYSDSGANARPELNTTLFWFASRFGDPSLLWTEKQFIERGGPGMGNDRILPALLVWSMGLKHDQITAPQEKMFYGGGQNPVALMRTSWSDPNALYIGFKAGTGMASHAHLDTGSFIFVADGIRWAEDLGMQNYESMESLGMKIWDNSPQSQRWDVFRYNNRSHNTLTFNNLLQDPHGQCRIDNAGSNDRLMFAVSDLTGSYRGQVDSICRGVAIVDETFAVIRDEITLSEETTHIKWNMATRATVREISGNKMILERGGRMLTLRVDHPSEVKLEALPGTPPNSWDAPNEDVTFVGFALENTGAGDILLQISLIPESADMTRCDFDLPLRIWPL